MSNKNFEVKHGLSVGGTQRISAAGVGTFTDLNVTGTTTTIDTATLQVQDKNIVINYGSGDTSSTASGAGITIQDAVNSSTDATLLWDASADEFDFSHTVTAPSLTIAGNATFDTSTLVVDSSNNRVGIGTASPQDKLHVYDGDVGIENSSGRRYRLIAEANGGFTIRDQTASSSRLAIDTSGNVQVGASSVANCLIGNDGNSINIKSKKDGTDAIPLTFMTQASGGALAERMRIDGSGLVGIGQTPSSSDGSMLQITGNDGIQLKRSGQTNGFVIRPNASTDGIRFTQGGTGDRMTINSSGQVGIGTTSPTFALDVQSSGSQVRIRETNTSGYGTLRVQAAGNTHGLEIDCFGTTSGGAYGVGSGGCAIMNVNSTPLAFGVGNSTDMMIDSSGRLLIGITATQNAGSFSGRNNDALQVRGAEGINSRSTANGGGCFIALADASNTAGSHFISVNTSGAVDFRVYNSNGNVANTNMSYGSLSDERIKSNIEDAGNKLEQLKQVKIRTFIKNDSPDQKQIGVIAQELETIFPSMVEEILDIDAEGNVLETSTKMVKYSVFIPILIKGMQEQQTIIEDLKSRIETLEG
jgi:hypothetical protein